MGALIVKPSSSSPSPFKSSPPPPTTTRKSSQGGNNGQQINHEQRQQKQHGEVDEDDETEDSEEDLEFCNRIISNIYGAATNVPLFGTEDVTSDIHAEISALGMTCQNGYNSKGCTAYITIPPCKRCFAALVAFGITRIVTRQEAPPLIQETATKHGIQVCNFTKEMNRAQMSRINLLVNNNLTNDVELMKFVEQRREHRQRQRQLKNNKKNADKQEENE